jgi:hypothetical protein
MPIEYLVVPVLGVGLVKPMLCLQNRMKLHTILVVTIFSSTSTVVLAYSLLLLLLFASFCSLLLPTMSHFYMAPDVGSSTRRALSQPSFTRGNDNMKLAMKFLNAPPVTYVIGKDQISIRVAAAAPVEAPIAFKIRSYDSILRQLEINKGRLSANEIVAAMSNHFDINTNVSEARSDRIRDLVRREIYKVENLQGIALLDVAGTQVT